MERTVRVDADNELWVEERGDPAAPAVVLVMGANASGVAWPDALVDRLAERYRVIRYDHRDVGRSSRSFEDHPYALRDLAGDVVVVLDVLDVERAHVVGMSMGGVLVQLLLLDHPDRLLTATVFATAALGSGLADPDGGSSLPGPSPELLEFWAGMGLERDAAAEIDWRAEHWRLLRNDDPAYDAAEFRDLERRVIQHSGTPRNPVAHALADQSGLERGPELRDNEVPTLVIEAPLDPINPPPHAEHLHAVIGSSTLVSIPGMGHALSHDVLGPFGAALLGFLDAHRP